MHEGTDIRPKKSWRNWEFVAIAGFLVIDELRNGFFLFLSSLDAVTLIVLLLAVWMLKDKKMPKVNLGLGKTGLFDGFTAFGKAEPKN